ncbi:MAG: hypothetical protein AAF628_24725 [Planctomycetota bacterium]
MTSPHAPDHDDLLRRLMVGDAAAADPDVRAILETCATCRAELAELRAMDARLDRAGALERRTVAAATPAPDLVDVDAVLAAAMHPSAPDGRTPRWGTLPWLLVAAAVVLGLGAWFVWPSTPSDEPELELGTRDLELLAPIGDDADFSVFRWSARTPARAFVLTVRSRAGAVVLPPKRVEATEWRPGAEEIEAWPKEIVWQVGPIAPDGSRGDIVTARARRR